MSESLLKPRFSYPAPPETQWCRDLFDLILRHIWRVSEIDFGEDVESWKTLTEPQRALVSKVLRGFVQTELVIRDYWSGVIARAFPLPEIVEMAIAISMQECIHAEAYQKLPATLGIDDYEALLGDKVAMQRLEYLLDNEAPPAERLAIFSGAVEGVSLFSAFALLCSFWKELGKLKGVYYVTTWSAADETLHSNAAIKLYHLYCAGNVNENLIYEGFDMVLANELAYINSAFSGAEPEALPIRQADLTEYIKMRANMKLRSLGLRPRYNYDPSQANNISSWFDPLVTSARLADFFAGKDGRTYQAKSPNTYNIDYKCLRFGSMAQ